MKWMIKNDDGNITEFNGQQERQNLETSNPFCAQCKEEFCCVSNDGTCAMTRRYHNNIVELSELRSLFSMQHKRMLKAEQAWKRATSSDYNPDLGVLLDWLMDRDSKIPDLNKIADRLEALDRVESGGFQYIDLEEALIELREGDK